MSVRQTQLDAKDLKELEQIQSSRKGWEYAVQTLQSGVGSGGRAETFLASSILYHKVARAFAELASEQERRELVEIVLKLLESYSGGPTRSKLNQVLAAIVVQFESLGSPLAMLPSALPDIGLVEVLCCLPDEADPHNAFVKCSLKRKKAVVKALRSESKAVLQLVDQLESSALPENAVRISKISLTCLANWLRSGNIRTVDFLQSPVSQRVLLFATGNNLELAMLASEAIGYTVDPDCGTFVPEEKPIITESMLVVLRRLLSATVNNQGIAEPAAEALANVAVFACELFVTEARGARGGQALSSGEYVSSLTELLGHQSDNVVLSIIRVWSHLSEILVKETEAARLFRPVMGQLILRSRHPLNGFQAEEDRESFNDLREAIRNLIRSYAVHSLDTVTLASWIRHELVAHRNDWQMFESLMHAFSALAKPMKKYGPDDNTEFILSSFVNLQHVSAPAAMSTLAMCSGVFAFAAGEGTILSAFLQVVGSSFKFREDDPNFPFRAADDHTGAVALMKLAQRCGPRIARHSAFAELVDVVINASHLLVQSKQLAFSALVTCACHLPGQECTQWVAKILEPLLSRREDLKIIAAALRATRGAESNPGGAFVRTHHNQFAQLGPPVLSVFKEVLSCGSWKSEAESIDIIVLQSLEALRSQTNYSDALVCLRLVIEIENPRAKVCAEGFMKEITPMIAVLVANIDKANAESLAAFLRLALTAGTRLPSSLCNHQMQLFRLFVTVLKTPRLAAGTCVTQALQYLPAVIDWAQAGNDEAQEVFKQQAVSYVLTLIQCLRTGVLPSWRFDESVRAVFSIRRIGTEHFYDILEQAARLDTANKHVKGFLTFLEAHKLKGQRSTEAVGSPLPAVAIDQKKLRAALKRLVGGKKKGTKGHPPKTKG